MKNEKKGKLQRPFTQKSTIASLKEIEYYPKSVETLEKVFIFISSQRAECEYGIKRPKFA